ncbi:MAG TPA: hypothetical protein VD837_07205 [Terriglobales bacterium]|nr:hypothetical protein [Terriglobales bacterium]
MNNHALPYCSQSLRLLVCLGILGFSAWTSANAQIATPQPAPGRSSAPVSAPAQMPSIGIELNSALSQLEQTAQQIVLDVGQLNIKKWKADSRYKEQSQHDADSIQANVTGTLPGIVSQVRTNPENVATMFKLYRNVDALYDVLRTLAESAGAFGPKDDYEVLAADTARLASVRGSLASQLDFAASAKEAEVSRLRTIVAQAQAARAAEPPKKIIVDDTEPKKPVRRKKPAQKKSDAAAATSSPPTK